MADAGWWVRLREKRPWWRIYPTRRLAALVALMGIAWIVPVAGARLAEVLIVADVALVAIDYLRLPRRNSITIERTAPDMIGLGDAADITYTIRSAWTWPARATTWRPFVTSFWRANPSRLILSCGAATAR